MKTEKPLPVSPESGLSARHWEERSEPRPRRADSAAKELDRQLIAWLSEQLNQTGTA